MKIRKYLISLITYIMLFGLVFSPITEATSNLKPVASSLTIYAPSALLIEKETGDILYERNAFEKMYPASTVKIMTAVLALENCKLEEIVTVNETALSAVPSGYTVANLQLGENLTVENLLYATLVPSGNDAANVLAEYVGGSIENFANIMTDKALEIGCINTNFTNPSGVHDENMVTTAYDLALIAKYAMNIDKFREIVTTPVYTLPSTNVYPNSDRVLKNSNHLIDTNSSHYYEFSTGIKTGYTNPAKNCLVAGAKKDNVEFIAVILGSPESNFGETAKFVDAKTLFEFGFNYYYDEYNMRSQQNNQNLLNGLLNLESIVDTSKVVNEENKLRWGYVAYLIARTVLILIAIIYVIYLFIQKVKRYIYNRTHAKYDYKY